MSETVVRQPVPLRAWHLVDQAAMLDCFTALYGEGWRGGVNYTGSVWRLEANADNPRRQVVAETGDWLIDDLGIRTVTAAEFADNYEADES